MHGMSVPAALYHNMNSNRNTLNVNLGLKCCTTHHLHENITELNEQDATRQSERYDKAIFNRSKHDITIS
jgi:hypothetical protein